jgi:CBS domain-containing protein
MRVEQLMTRKVFTVNARDTLSAAATIMAEQDVGVVPVVEGRRVIGILTDRDICLAAARTDKRLSQIPVERVMKRAVHACLPDEPIADIEERMRRAQIRRMPVTDEERRILGIVSLNDLAIASRSPRPDGVTRDEVAKTLAGICEHRQPPRRELRPAS